MTDDTGQPTVDRLAALDAASPPTPDQGAIPLPREPSEDAIEAMARKLYEQSYTDIRADDPGLREPEPWPDLNDAQRGFGLNMARAAYAALVKHLENPS